MIKTHKPRGHFWNCASAFQQSKEIRNIKFEDCTPPAAEVLGPDSDDELPPSERAAKRRRIEQLANDFLDGKALVIKSARPHPVSLRTAVEWNERNRTASKWSLPTVKKAKTEDQIWADVDDSIVALQKLSKTRKASKRPKSRRTQPRPQQAPSNVEIATEVQQATSGCKPAMHLRGPKISTEPSTEAVKLAAALRARKLQKAATEAPQIPDSASRHATPVFDAAESRSEPVSQARPRYFRTRKTEGIKWLLRRNTKLLELSPDESFDELSRSGMQTPSRIQHHSTTGLSYSSPVMTTPSAEPAPAHNATDGSAGPINTAEDPTSSRDPLALSFSQRLAAAGKPPDQSDSVEPGSYQTAPESTDLASALLRTLRSESQPDSPAHLLAQQGVRAAPRKSWASINEPVYATKDDSPHTTPVEDDATSSHAAVIQRPLQESALKVSNVKKGKRAKSAGNNTPQPSEPSRKRGSAPTTSQNALKALSSLPANQQRPTSASGSSLRKPAYTEAQPAQQGDTPFVFRKKRASNVDNGNTTSGSTAKQEKKSRRRVTFPSSEDTRRATSHQKGATLAVTAEPPVLDMSLDHDSSFGMRLNMALVDKHLNAVLPMEPDSSRRSSSVKKALRREMLESGAKFERVHGEPASSQAGADRVSDPPRMELEDEAFEDLSSAIEHARRESVFSFGHTQSSVGAADASESAQTQWPGTQAAMYQAQHDLITSPEKPANVSCSVTGTTPEPSRVNTALSPDTTVRKALRVLSQEQLPGTQALMEGWSPWSVMKKPKPPTPRNVAPSPSVCQKGSSARRQSARQPHAMSHSVTASDGVGLRRSSLRFSTSASDSPLQSSRLDFTISKPSSSHDSGKRVSSSDPSTARPILKNAGAASQPSPRELPLTWDPTTVMSFDAAIQSDPTKGSSAGLQFSSYEEGQGRLMQEDLDLNRTIDELTASVLSTSDLNGVLS